MDSKSLAMPDTFCEIVRTESPYILFLVGSPDRGMISPSKHRDYLFVRTKRAFRASNEFVASSRSYDDVVRILRMKIASPGEVLDPDGEFALRFTLPVNIVESAAQVLYRCSAQCRRSRHPLAWLPSQENPASSEDKAKPPVRSKGSTVVAPKVETNVVPLGTRSPRNPISEAPVGLLEPVTDLRMRGAIRLHVEMQVKTGEIARNIGLEFHYAKNDRNALHNGRKVCELLPDAVERLPFAHGREPYNLVDMLWLQHGEPVALFEVETSTNIDSGINRMLSLVGPKRNTSILNMYIVAPEERKRAVLERIQATFKRGDTFIYKRVRFMSVEQVNLLHEISAKLGTTLNFAVLEKFSSGFEETREKGLKTVRFTTASQGDFPIGTLWGTL